MEKELNFTSVFYRREDRIWGGRSDNGSFYGVINDLHTGSFDMFSSSLTLKVDRSYGVTYLTPIGTETYALFIPVSGT